MRTRRYKNYCADFETTVYSGQEKTEVWAAAMVELYSDDVHVWNNITDFINYSFDLAKETNIRIYFHNLKFDGSFLLDHMINVRKMKQAYYLTKPGKLYSAHWYNDANCLNNSFKYLISDMGQWYMITIFVHNHVVQIVDSFKLIPDSVENIGKSFETKHRKLSITYEGERHAGGEITAEEQLYIRNDVLVMKEALEIMLSEGHTNLTIGACCLAEFKKLYCKLRPDEFDIDFPDVSTFALDEDIFGSVNADAYIRKAYRGGWCYLVSGKENRVFHDGITLDVNSLYASMMSAASGNRIPYGMPKFWKGDYIPDEAQGPDRYFYIRIRTRFEIKYGFLPTIQIKNNALYCKNEYLTSSKIRIGDSKYSRVRVGEREYDDIVTLTLTMTDYHLFLDHYNVWDFEILDGCWFRAKVGLFDEYIEKYKQIKMHSTGAKRKLAKMYLTNLYGKLATGDNSSFKIAYPKEDGSLGFYTISDHSKKLVYIPAGAAITAYARNFTIRAAQLNYYGPDQPGTIYSDTDSLHLDLPLDKVRGVTIHDSEFLCWAHEASWHTGIFLRQKTYVEIGDQGASVTACGMGKRCKELIAGTLSGSAPEPRNKDEEEFLKNFHSIEDFKIGLEVPSNLKQFRIPGGVVLKEDYFCIR